ncbi:sporulation histidine kinase inhibitor Sda [Pseudogracilibacillus sp. SO30301A]
MENLSNDLIIEAYNKAIELKLDDDFQLMLKKEILRRKLELNNLSKISEF